jgi:hypothetical protein
MSEMGRWSVTIALQLCLRICHYVGSSKPSGVKLNGTHQFLVYADDVNLVGESIDTLRKTQKLY